MTPSREQSPIPEYARLLRARWRLIAVLALLCGAAALAFSLTQHKRYEATASLQFNDPSLDAGRAGAPTTSAGTAAELAAQGAQTVLSPSVLSATKAQLGARETVDQLRDALKAEVDPKSNLVRVTATVGEPRFAARLADTVAQQAVDRQTRAVRAGYQRSAERTARQLRSLRGSKNQATQLAIAERLTPLRTLAANAEPVTRAQAAAVPSSPVSPKPIADTIVGLLVGLLLGVLVAFMRDALDRRLKNAGDVRDHLELPVVASVRDEALGLTPFVEGERGTMAEQDIESFRVLRKNLEFMGVDTPGQVVAVTSPMPEEGKSTVAASLAFTNAAAGKRTLLVECDLRRPALAARLGASAEPGLSEYLVEGAGPSEMLQVVSFSEQPPLPAGSENGGRPQRAPLATDTEGRLAFISAGAEALLPAELLGSQRFAAFLDQVKEVYQAVIVDTAPLLSVADTLEILPMMDRILICVRVGRTTRDQATAGKSALEWLPPRPTGVVVTGLSAAHEGSYGYYGYGYGRRAPELSGSA